MKDAALNWIIDQYCIINDYMRVGEIVYKVLGGKGDSTSDVVVNATKTLMSTVVPSLSSVAMAIAVLFFLISLVELATSDRFTMEYFIKFFSKLVIALVLITMCEEITGYCMDFGNALNKVLGTATGVDGSSWAQKSNAYRNTITNMVYEKAETSKWFIMVVNTVGSTLVLELAAIALFIVTYVICYSRFMELGIRACLMPLAFAMISDDGWRGAGGRYIKKFLAVCCQGVVLMMVAFLSETAIVSLSLDPGADLGVGSLVSQLGIGIASVTLMFKSIGFVNDVFGV